MTKPHYKLKNKVHLNSLFLFDKMALPYHKPGWRGYKTAHRVWEYIPSMTDESHVTFQPFICSLSLLKE